MSAPTPSPAVLSAAASLTWQGAAVVVTVTADDPAILARRLDRLLATLSAAAGSTPPPQHAPAAPSPVCPVHGAALTWRTPKGAAGVVVTTDGGRRVVPRVGRGRRRPAPGVAFGSPRRRPC
ncbi:MAG: hypothetical protein U0531_22525 [Dehalococcoidia bacterium]